MLLKHLKSTNRDPKLLPSIFTKEVIEHINIITLKGLLENGFVVNALDPDLLTLCMQRKDKTIFQVYARAWSEQTKQPDLWKHIDKNEYNLLDLQTPIGLVSLLNALIFLRKNEQVKKAWQDTISVEMIKSALTTAIINGNTDMSHFLEEKLRARKNPLEHDTLEFLYQKGLNEEDISILTILSKLNFNVLHSIQDIPALLSLCDDYDDFSIITTCFEKAGPKVKQSILETSFNWNMTPVIKTCAEKEPQLFNKYLNESTTSPKNLGKLNKVVHLLPANTLSLQLDALQQKQVIRSCFKNKHFHLAQILCAKVAWEESELNLFLNNLMQEKNEDGIIFLINIYPQLNQKPELLHLLTLNNLLKVVDSVLPDEKLLEEGLTKQIFTAALANNHRGLISKFLYQGRVTPQTSLQQPLTELLKQVIAKGNEAVLEPFIQSKGDFGINFKELFLFSCANQQGKAANQLLANEFTLSNSEAKLALQHLFGDQSDAAVFETIYQHGYGRLCRLLSKATIPNPRAELLSSIKNPELDIKFQQTFLYLSPIKRAIEEKNKPLFNALFAEANMPAEVDHDILNFLKDPIIVARVLPRFVQKYTLKKLLTAALEQKEWAVVANLIEKYKLNDLDADLQQSLQDHGKEIVLAYLANIETYYDKGDVRPQLFKLLDHANTHALAQLAIPYRDATQKSLEKIELDMLKKGLELNNQIYRHTFSNQSFKNALDGISKACEQSIRIIAEQQIDLCQPLENPQIIDNLAQIKTLLARYDISPDYLSDEHTALLEQLIENPRFKNICAQELQLYLLLKEFNPRQEPISARAKANQEQFTQVIKTLNTELEQAKLAVTFVLPEIQSHLQSYQGTLNTASPKKQTPKKSVTFLLPETQLPLKSDQGTLNTPQSPVQKPKEQDSSTKSPAEHSQLAKLKQKCNHALNHYLKHRDATLSFLSYFFDYDRGKIRAQHYKNLIKAAQTPTELHVIEYAILANSDGTQIKKDVFAKLGYKNEKIAKDKIKAEILKNCSTKHLTLLDNIIDSINDKINASDSTPTVSLFKNELTLLKQIATAKRASEKHSFLGAKNREPQTGFWHWIASWFETDKTEDNRLSPKK